MFKKCILTIVSSILREVPYWNCPKIRFCLASTVTGRKLHLCFAGALTDTKIPSRRASQNQNRCLQFLAYQKEDFFFLECHKSI